MTRLGLTILMIVVAFLAFATISADSGSAQSATPEIDISRSAANIAEDIRAGRLTAEATTRLALARIDARDRSGPRIQSVISINPEALDAARALDNEARAGQYRSALHGVPILLKDNIESRELLTTAGSLALLDNRTERDAPLVTRPREAGLVMLGKTNLSEWANYRSSKLSASWLAATAGYPALTVPMGDYRGLPLGLMFVGTAWDDATVLRAGHAFEAEAAWRHAPTFVDGDTERPPLRDLVSPVNQSAQN